MKPGWGSAPPSAASLPYIATIRRASEWKGLGFPPKFTSDGRLAKAPPRQPYRFEQPIFLDPEHLAGIETGLRVATSLGLADLEELALSGVRLEEFVGLPAHASDYLRGTLLLKAGDHNAALPFLERATKAEPDQSRYRDRYFETRQQAGDLAAILREIEANAATITHCVHSGKAAKWVRDLYAAGKKQPARAAIGRVDELLRKICDAPQGGGQSREWNISKHQQFVKNARAFGVKLAPYYPYP